MRDDLLLTFAGTGGAVAWTIQLWLGWLLGDLACHLQPGEFRLAGLDTGALWVLLGVVTFALAAVALLVSWRFARGAHSYDDQPTHGARRFLAACALILNLLLVGTIALGATAPLLVPACL